MDYVASNAQGDPSHIIDALGMTYAVMNTHSRPMCSISGGADSDIVLDMVWRLDPEKKVRYVFFNTGLEYQATKEHLNYLEQQYDIKIERIPAIKSVPQCCREYGQPFLSKQVSTYMAMLQKYQFTWEDLPLSVLLERYPRITSAIKWWCNKYNVTQWRIDSHSYLKEFLIAHPPTFSISQACCTWAKKKVAKTVYTSFGHDLDIVGIRKEEGGIRSWSIKSCFSQAVDRDLFCPIFWFSDADKTEYKNLFDIHNSNCYSVYGLQRTGCIGCPFNRKLLDELHVMKQYEYGLYKAACTVFRDSYAYTALYRNYIVDRRKLSKRLKKEKKASVV